MLTAILTIYFHRKNLHEKEKKGDSFASFLEIFELSLGTLVKWTKLGEWKYGERGNKESSALHGMQW